MQSLSLLEAKNWVERIYAEEDARNEDGTILNPRPKIAFIKALREAYAMGSRDNPDMADIQELRLQYDMARAECSAYREVIGLLVDKMRA